MSGRYRGWRGALALLGVLWLLGLGIAHVVEWWGNFALGK